MVFLYIGGGGGCLRAWVRDTKLKQSGSSYGTVLSSGWLLVGPTFIYWSLILEAYWICFSVVYLLYNWGTKECEREMLNQSRRVFASKDHEKCNGTVDAPPTDHI